MNNEDDMAGYTPGETAALKGLFDMFDVEKTGQVRTADLEDILEKVGRDPNEGMCACFPLTLLFSLLSLSSLSFFSLFPSLYPFLSLSRITHTHIPCIVSISIVVGVFPLLCTYLAWFEVALLLVNFVSVNQMTRYIERS